MKILIVGLVKNPQLKRLVVEGKKLGHVVEGCYSAELVIETEKGSFNPTLRGKEIDHDLIYLWAIGKRRWEWYTAVNYIEKTRETVIVNKKITDKNYNYFLSAASDYEKQVENNLPFPKSALIFDQKGAEVVINKFDFPLILKTAEGRQGRGVFKLNSKDEVRKTIIELSKNSVSFVIREFIPNNGDIRVFTVGYKAIGAMKRTPVEKGEFRSNISLGGKGEKFDLDKFPKIRDIAEKLSEITRTQIAGVDIMVHKETHAPYILEINPGPQFTGFEKYTGINAAREIIKYFEKLDTNKRK